MGNLEDSGFREFNFEGRFLEFLLKEGKPKYLRLDWSGNVLQVKLAKQLRANLPLNLRPGDPILVQGSGHCKQGQSQFKLKASQVTPLTPIQPVKSTLPEIARQPQKFLICQKSGCLKRGAKRFLQALEMAIGDRGLHTQIVIERTKCLGRCSSAPNLVVLPEKKHYSRLQTDAILALLEKHCPGELLP